MPETAEKLNNRRSLVSWKLILAIVLIIAYTAGASYAVMSDTSARGLTVKIYTISRSCSPSSSSIEPTLSYSVGGAIWSSASLPTHLTHVTFIVSIDGSIMGTATGSDSSFGPGQSTAFNLSFPCAFTE